VKKAIKAVLLGLVVFTTCFTLIYAPIALAADFNIPRGGFQPNYNNETPKNLVENLLNWFFVIAAIVCVAVIVWAGISYATAGGDEEKVEKAKNRLIYGIIGVVLIIGAYAITQLIRNAIEGGNIPTPTL